MTRRSASLRLKTMAALVAVAVLASLAFSAVWYATAVREQRRMVDGILAASAARASTALEGVISASLDAARIQARLLSGEMSSLGDLQVRRRVHGMLTTFRASDPLHLIAIAVVSLDGTVRVATDGERTFGDRLSDSFVHQAASLTTPRAGSIRMVDGDDRHGRFRLFATIRDDRGRPEGVLVAEYSTAIFERILREQARLAGRETQAFLYDRYVVRMAGTVESHLLFRTNNTFDDTLRDRLIADRRLRPTPPEEQSRRGVRELRQLSDSTYTYAIDQRDDAGRWRKWIGASSPVRPFGGQIAIEWSDEGALGATRRKLLRDAILLLGIITLTVGGLAALVGDRLTRPVLELTAAVRRFGDGERDARVPVRSDDETGQLAASFNELADRVENLVVGLDERSRALEADIRKREQLEAQLIETRKLEAVGKLAGGIAHDFNNLIAVVLANIDFLRDSVSDEAAREALADVEEAARRGSDLTRQLLTFARRGASDARIVDLGQALRESERLLTRMVGSHIRISLVTPPQPVCVRIDPAQLQQILFNLAVNARDAMPAGGDLTFTVALVGSAGDPAGQRATLVVRDTGEGMPPDTVRRIFDPFFTTKAAGRGSGLGLATVHGIVTGASGSITVESEPGRGTEFHLLFPLAEGTPDGVAPRALPIVARRSATILVVEDEPGVRHAVSRALRRAGHRVFEASTGAEGLALARLHGDALDLVLSDIVMPDGDGRQLARSLAGEHPRLKVLLMSGYGGEQPLGGGAPQFDVLDKPFSSETLLVRVDALLEAPV